MLKNYLLCYYDECHKDCEELKCYNDVGWRTQFQMQEVKTEQALTCLTNENNYK